MMAKKSNENKKIIMIFIGALLFVFSAVGGSALIDRAINYASGKPAPTSTPTPPVQIFNYESVTCPKDINAFEVLRRQSSQTVDLIAEPKRMFAANNEFINPQIIVTKSETKDSKVACGYLFVKVHTDNGSLQPWEDLYINPDNFGGHIDKSNQFGIGDGREFSEYLFSLSDIRYWKTIQTRRTIKQADWSALLNVQDTVRFEIALNSQNSGGTIEKMSIVYKCWNPATGEENVGCKLNAETESDKRLKSLN